MKPDSTTLPTEHPLQTMRSYGLAFVCLAIALGFRLVFDELWKDRLPYVSFFLAELVIMRLAGPGPTAFTAVAGFLTADWFFVRPRHSLLIEDRVNQVNAGFYFLVSSILIFFSVRERRLLANVKTLRGLLPICASCKKIRDDKGYWNQIELYIRERSDARFTHGICPDCAGKLYGNVLNPPADQQR